MSAAEDDDYYSGDVGVDVVGQDASFPSSISDDLVDQLGDFGNNSDVKYTFYSMKDNKSEEIPVELPEYVATVSLVLCSLVLAVG